jgi:hypothetical protein
VEAATDAARPVIRDAVRRAVFLGIALVLLAGVIVFAELAFYLWLRTQTAPYYAALIVAGVTLVLTLIALLIAVSGGGSNARKAPERPERPVSASFAADAGSSAAKDEIARLVADAEAVGALFGKDAKGYELVLGAFIVGMMMGREK